MPTGCFRRCDTCPPLPRLPDDLRLRQRAAPPAGRRASWPAPRTVTCAVHRPHGLRRLFRQRGKARQPGAARPAGHRRRRPAGRRVDLLLSGADQGRPLGHADVPGAEALPRGGGGQAADSPPMSSLSRAIRAMMEDLTPAIEPLSLDEAFLDLTGTERLHGAPPAVMLARLTKRMEGGTGPDRLHRPVAQQVPGQDRLGSGQAARVFRHRPGRDGVSCARARAADLGRRHRDAGRAGGAPASAPSPICCAGTAPICSARFGQMGDRLWHLARGEDHRRVSPRRSR
jgi:hypothetical protein